MGGEDEFGFSRFQELMGDEGWEIVVPVLKGHILIEEELENSLKAILPNPSALIDDATNQGSFHRKIQYLDAVIDRNWPRSNDLIKALKDFNRLRNHLAHKRNVIRDHDNQIIRTLLDNPVCWESAGRYSQDKVDHFRQLGMEAYWKQLSTDLKAIVFGIYLHLIILQDDLKGN